MNMTRMMVAVLIAGSALALHVTHAQQPGIKLPAAASYAPITILVDERADGVHLSYDSMASLIAPYGSEPAFAVVRELDLKVVSLLEAAA